nr:PREDICTED: cationic amino acid transporter 1-like isoform X2 [Daucus carota subsp. sativus]
MSELRKSSSMIQSVVRERKMVVGDSSGQGIVRTMRYGCNINNFLPEESFKSWGNYGRVLGNTKSWLTDRLLTQSSDESELHKMRARCQNEMTKLLNWFDMMWFGSVLGAGVFFLTGQAARDYVGPAVIISYLISGLSALLSVLCYTEFSVDLPVAGGSFLFLFFCGKSGGSFVYLRVELGQKSNMIQRSNFFLSNL